MQAARAAQALSFRYCAHFGARPATQAGLQSLAMSPHTIQSPAARAAALQAALRTIIRGQDEVIRLALVTLFARGHLLIEDVPGVGKTTLAQALARALDCAFQRIQFTSDMLPSDVLGISMYSAASSASNSSVARSSPTSCSPTRSTAPRPRPSPRCWRR